MIRLDNVWKVYEFGKVTALKSVSLTFEDGLFYMITGPSGSGKTTLLNIVTGVDVPTKGSVIIDGVEISGMSEGRRRRFRLRNFGVVFQFFHLVPYLTGLENVMLPLRFLGFRTREAEEIAYEALRKVNGGHLAGKFPSEMSAGEMQRVAIARAIAPKPKYVVADEPTASLDWSNKVNVWSLFRRLQKELGVTVIAVSHEVDFARYVDVVIELRDGEVRDIKGAGA